MVQWTNVGYYSGTGNVTFQIRLYETSNLVEFAYGSAVDNASASGSIGLNDAVGGSGHIISITPAATCEATLTSTTVCNDLVPYLTVNLNSTLKYSFGTPIGIINNNQHPKAYKLYDNYPNPFNPTTTINFDLPKQMELKLSVYNSVGQLVEILASGNYSPGSFSFKWDGSNYSSGLYFYKLEAGEFTDVKKMMLVK